MCLAAALLAQAGRWFITFDLLAEIAPLWLLGSIASVTAALFVRGRRRRVVLLTGLAGSVAAGALLAPELFRPSPGRAAGEPGFRLRVIQINFGGRDVKDPDRVAAWLTAQNPDLVFVDDVLPPVRAAIERRGFFWRRGTAWTGIASRLPLLPAPFPFSAADWKAMPDLARARFPTPYGPADLIAVHLVRPFPGIGPGDTKVASDRLIELAGRYGNARLIIGGDLNLTPWSFLLRRLDARLGLARRDRADFTWPARAFNRPWPIPIMPLDHLYAGSAWKTADVWIGPPIGTTHRALVVDLVEAPPLTR